MFKVYFDNEWHILRYDDEFGVGVWVDCSECIPEDLRTSSMNTNKDRVRWFLNRQMIEERDVYYCGLYKEAWIEENAEWISLICHNMDECSSLYEKINEADF